MDDQLKYFLYEKGINLMELGWSMERCDNDDNVIIRDETGKQIVYLKFGEMLNVIKTYIIREFHPDDHFNKSVYTQSNLYGLFLIIGYAYALHENVIPPSERLAEFLTL